MLGALVAIVGELLLAGGHNPAGGWVLDTGLGVLAVGVGIQQLSVRRLVPRKIREVDVSRPAYRAGQLCIVVGFALVFLAVVLLNPSNGRPLIGTVEWEVIPVLAVILVAAGIAAVVSTSKAVIDTE